MCIKDHQGRGQLSKNMSSYPPSLGDWSETFHSNQPTVALSLFVSPLSWLLSLSLPVFPARASLPPTQNWVDNVIAPEVAGCSLQA